MGLSGNNCQYFWLLRCKKLAKCRASGPKSPMPKGEGKEVMCNKIPAPLSFTACSFSKASGNTLNKSCAESSWAYLPEVRSSIFCQSAGASLGKMIFVSFQSNLETSTPCSWERAPACRGTATTYQERKCCRAKAKTLSL